MKAALKSATVLCLFAHTAAGFSFVPATSSRSHVSLSPQKNNDNPAFNFKPSESSSSSLSMVDLPVDMQVIKAGGVAAAGLGVGIGLVAFAESMGERSRERGEGLSDRMATQITGGLMEDVEVDSVSDLSSLTDKLEAALMETGGADEKELQMSEESKKRIAEEADDGW